jgi:STE24 endopeptidase
MRADAAVSLRTVSLLGALLFCAHSLAPASSTSSGWYEVSAAEAPATDFFTADEIAAGKGYHAERLAFWCGFLALELGFWTALLASGLASRFARLAERVARGRFWLSALLLFAGLFVLRELVLHPLAMASYFHRRAHGLSNQTLGAWHLERLLWAGGEVPIAALGMTIAYVLLRRSPRRWWLWTGGVAAAFIALGMYIYPVLVSPVFNDFTTLADGPLKHRLVELAARAGAGVDVEAIQIMDASRQSRHSNAYVAGLGATQRIVLFDTLLEDHNDAEVASVVAHELGHWNHAHVEKATALAATGAVVLLFLAGRFLGWWSRRGWCSVTAKWSLAGAPVFILFLTAASLASLPLQSAVSRHFERQADEEELALACDPAAMVSSLQKMARRNLSNVEPPPFVQWFLGSHPSTMDRIRRALAEKRRLEGTGAR